MEAKLIEIKIFKEYLDVANIKSAQKRIDTNKRQRGENRFVKSTLNTYVKGFRALIAEGKIAEAEAKLTETISYIDSACSKGVLHRNNASRKISRLTSALHKAKLANPAKEEVKPAKVAKVEEVKPVEEVKAEATPKKAPAKKTTKKVAEPKAEAPKKAPAKKTTAKKEVK